MGERLICDRDAAAVVAAAAAALLLAAREEEGAAAAAAAAARRAAFVALCAKLRPETWARRSLRGCWRSEDLRSAPPVPPPESVPSPIGIAAAAQEDAWLARAAAGCDGPGERDLRQSGLLQEALGVV